MAGNFFSVPLMFGVDFIFGSIFVLIVLCVFGVPSALVSALLAGGTTWFLWNHGYGIVLHAVEVVAIGLVYRKLTRNLIVCAAFYWFVAGVPIAAALGVWAMQLDWIVAWMLATKQGANGVFNALFASAALITLPFEKWSGRRVDPYHRSLSQAIHTLITLLIFAPTLLIAILAGRNTIEGVEARVDYILASSTASVQSHFSHWKESRLLAAGRLARSLASVNGDEAIRILELQASSLQDLFPDLSHIVLTDDSGVVRRVFPETNAEGALFVPGHDFSTLPHFQRVRDEPLPYFSFDRDGSLEPPVHFVAAPLHKGETFAGSILCVLDPTGLERIFRSHGPFERLVSLVTMDDETLFGPFGDWREQGEWVRAKPIILRDSPVFLQSSQQFREPRIRQWINGYYGLETDLAEGLDSRLLLKVPAAPFQDEVFSAYANNLLMVLVLVAFSMFVSMIVCRRLAAPVSQLAALTADMPGRVKSGTLDLDVEEPFPEFDRLLANFRSAANALHENFGLLACKDAMIEERRKSEAEARTSLRHTLGDYARQLEQRVQERTAQLAASNREMETFCYSITHDLRAPLRAIRNFSQLVEKTAEHRGASAVEIDLLARIHRAADQMDALITNLLAYSRLGRQEVPFEPVAIEPIVKLAMEPLANDIEEGRAEITLSGDFPAVRANPTILQQVLTNLLSNAIKYVPPEKTPKIDVFCREQDNGKVRIFIGDNGIGIPADAATRIFNVFERLHESSAYAGTGLGLAIVQRGVSRMDGTVGIDPAPGEGSLFWIELPAADSAPPPRAPET